MDDNLTEAAICPRCCFCGHSVANPGDMCGMCAGSIAAHQLRLARAAADHLAREIDEALGGLVRAYGAVTAEYQEQREWSCGHEQEFPTRDHVSLDQGDTINGHWISGWTPEETPNA